MENGHITPGPCMLVFEHHLVLGEQGSGTGRGQWLLLSSAPPNTAYPALTWLTAQHGFLQAHLIHPLLGWVLNAG